MCVSLYVGVLCECVYVCALVSVSWQLSLGFESVWEYILCECACVGVCVV